MYSQGLSAPISYGGSSVPRSTSFPTPSSYGASTLGATSNTILPTTYGPVSSYGGSTSFTTPISSSYGASILGATSNTVLPTTYGPVSSFSAPPSSNYGASSKFAPGQRIDYKARSNGTQYAGSVICQTATGGLKIKLDIGDMKEVAPADLYRVSLAPTATTSGTTRASTVAPQTSRTFGGATTAASTPISYRGSSLPANAQHLPTKTILPSAVTSQTQDLLNELPGKRIYEGANQLSSSTYPTYPSSQLSSSTSPTYLASPLSSSPYPTYPAAEYVAEKKITKVGALPAASSSPYPTYPAAEYVAKKKITKGGALPAAKKTLESHGLDLLGMGNVVSERVVSTDELIGTGQLVEAEVEIDPTYSAYSPFVFATEVEDPIMEVVTAVPT